MKGMGFERRRPACDGIHNNVSFNKYDGQGERDMTIGQFAKVLLCVLALALMYAIFGMMEG